MTSDPWWAQPLASSAAGGGAPEGADFEFEHEEPFFSPDIVRVVQGEYWILAQYARRCSPYVGLPRSR